MARVPPHLEPVIREASRKATEEANDPEFRRRLEGATSGLYFKLNSGEAAWDSRAWHCMIPGCLAQRTIGSHVIQRGGPLRCLAEATAQDPAAQVVIGPQWEAKSLNRIGRSISIDQASTFPGYCEKHDGPFFKKLENGPFPMTRRGRHLQLYRSWCREARRLRHSLEVARTVHAELMSLTSGALRPLFLKHLPEGVLADHPQLRDLPLTNKGDLDSRIKALHGSQESFVTETERLRGVMDGFASGRSSRIDAAMRHWTMPVTLPYAFSGIGDIGEPHAPVPMLMFALPGDRVSEIAVLVHQDHLEALDRFLAAKRIGRRWRPSRSRALLSVAEQFMFDATNHWFMRSSAWAGLDEAVRVRAVARTSENKNSLHSSPPASIFPEFPGDLRRLGMAEPLHVAAAWLLRLAGKLRP